MAIALFFDVVSLGCFAPGLVFKQHYHVDRHGHLTLKQLRLYVLNKMHTNSYTGPGLMHAVTPGLPSMQLYFPNMKYLYSVVIATQQFLFFMYIFKTM